MYWKTFGEFLAMGGYGLYVWGSFGLGVVVLAWELLALRVRRRKALAAVRARALLDAPEDRPAPHVARIHS